MKTLRSQKKKNPHNNKTNYNSNTTLQTRTIFYYCATFAVCKLHQNSMEVSQEGDTRPEADVAIHLLLDLCIKCMLYWESLDNSNSAEVW